MLFVGFNYVRSRAGLTQCWQRRAFWTHRLYYRAEIWILHGHPAVFLRCILRCRKRNQWKHRRGPKDCVEFMQGDEAFTWTKWSKWRIIIFTTHRTFFNLLMKLKRTACRESSKIFPTWTRRKGVYWKLRLFNGGSVFFGKSRRRWH